MRRLLLLAILAACHRDIVVDVGPVSDVQAKAFVTSLLDTVGASCDTDKIAPLVDEEALAGYVLQHSKAEGPERVIAAKTMEDRRTGATVLCSWFALEPGSKFSFLHLVDGAPIIRKMAKVNHTTAVTYFRLVLGTTKSDNVVRVDDAYSFTEGTTISEGLAETVDAGIKAGVTSSLNLTKAMKEITALRADHKPQEAMATLDALPAEMRELRALRVLRVFIAREISNERYSQEMAAVLAKYPNDPSLALIAIDEAALRKDYPGTLKQIDLLDHAIGGDAFQDAVRASIYFQAGDFKQARAHAEAAVKVEPRLVRAQFSLVDAEAALHDNTAVLATLRTLAKLGQTLPASAIAPLPHYDEFAKSPEFQIWAAEHP
ncbi:MAG: hypothetical protein ABI591_30700 [Kofleriaceae bacterium]